MRLIAFVSDSGSITCILAYLGELNEKPEIWAGYSSGGSAIHRPLSAAGAHASHGLNPLPVFERKFHSSINRAIF
ncbi:MAG: hypothetical protein ACREX3_04965, partial [Gammaproteobacteria bacterium]